MFNQFKSDSSLTPSVMESMDSSVHDIDRFQNNLPDSDLSTTYAPLIRPSRSNTDVSSIINFLRPNSKVRSLFWPTLVITVPIALLSAALLALVFGYRVESEPSIFRHDGSKDPYVDDPAYLLVNFSATRLVFAASFLSTVAPLLTSFVMTLWSLLASNTLRQASESSQIQQLPTPYQLSLLIGVCLASIEQLRMYLRYLFSRRRTSTVAPALKKSAAILILCVCLAFGVFVADTVLHYMTSTVVFDQIRTISHPTSQLGRGLSSMCLDLNRTADNYGFPCSMNMGEKFEDENRTAKRNELYRLQSNTSHVSQIRVAEAEGTGDHIAIIIPEPSTIMSEVDYRASTVGIATQCRFVPPPACNMSVFGEDEEYTQFNCSNNFFGVLGMTPNINPTNERKLSDPNLSTLGFKSSINLQWAFFEDSDLTIIYNPESWDPATGQPDGLNMTLDSHLLNPYYLGLATRMSINAFTVNSSVTTKEQNVFNIDDGALGYIDLILSCSITAHDVNYTWYKSEIHNVTSAPSPNGTLSEIFHGAQQYNSVTGGGYDLQQYIINAAIAGDSSASFLTTWGNLYSVKVLSIIGAYSTPRINLEEQFRQTIMVAKVPIAVLGALIAFSLIYTLLGFILLIAAYRVSTTTTTAIAEQLSLAGLSMSAFRDSQNGSGNYSPMRYGETRGFDHLNTPNGDDDYFLRQEKKEMTKIRVNGDVVQGWV